MFRPLAALAAAALVATAVAAADPKPVTLHVKAGGLKREAVVYAAADAPKGGAPVVFVFHGHGGTVKDAVRDLGVHEFWPEAVVVYMQGVPTPRPSDPKGEKLGWQTTPGEQDDRDLKFFDEAYAGVKKDYLINEKRVCAVGFSNGAGMSVLVWEQRPAVIAAVAVFSGGPGGKLKTLKPRPCLVASGVKETGFEKQEKAAEGLRKLNGCVADGTPWPPKGKVGATLYPSPTGTPVVWYPHPGAHEVPKGAAQLTVRFLRENTLK